MIEPGFGKVNKLKNYLGLIPVAIFAILLGCGGGGGGGSSTNGGNGSTTGFTSGDTSAGAGSTLLGQTVDSTNSGLGGVTVKFFDPGGNQVGSAVSRANGYFDANLPTNATRCEVDAATVPGSVQKLYRYNNKNYQAVGGGLTCNRILLPTITPGVLTPMATAMVFYVNGTPPIFPDGCF